MTKQWIVLVTHVIGINITIYTVVITMMMTLRQRRCVVLASPRVSGVQTLTTYLVVIFKEETNCDCILMLSNIFQCQAILAQVDTVAFWTIVLLLALGMR